MTALMAGHATHWLRPAVIAMTSYAVWLIFTFTGSWLLTGYY